jgi:hypothetical protein
MLNSLCNGKKQREIVAQLSRAFISKTRHKTQKPKKNFKLQSRLNTWLAKSSSLKHHLPSFIGSRSIDNKRRATASKSSAPHKTHLQGFDKSGNKTTAL